MTKILDFKSPNIPDSGMPMTATLFQLCCIAETRCFLLRDATTRTSYGFAYLPDAACVGELAVYAAKDVMGKTNEYFTYETTTPVRANALENIVSLARTLIGDGDWEVVPPEFSDES